MLAQFVGIPWRIEEAIWERLAALWEAKTGVSL